MLPSDHGDELVERGSAAKLPMERLSARFAVSASQVLDERVIRDQNPGSPVGLQSAHRPKPRAQSDAVAFDPIVGVQRSGQEVGYLAESTWVASGGCRARTAKPASACRTGAFERMATDAIRQSMSLRTVSPLRRQVRWSAAAWS